MCVGLRAVVALRRALAQVAPRGVEHFGRLPRQRERHLQRLHRVGGVRGVAKGQSLAEQSARAQREFGASGEPCLGVDEVDLQLVPVCRDAGDREPRTEGPPVAMPFEGGGAEPAAGLRGDESETCGLVESARDALGCGGDGERPQRRIVEFAEVVAPVHHDRVRLRLEIDDDARPSATKVHRRWCTRAGAAGGGDIGVVR